MNGLRTTSCTLSIRNALYIGMALNGQGFRFADSGSLSYHSTCLTPLTGMALKGHGFHLTDSGFLSYHCICLLFLTKTSHRHSSTIIFQLRVVCATIATIHKGKIKQDPTSLGVTQTAVPIPTSLVSMSAKANVLLFN